MVGQLILIVVIMIVASVLLTKGTVRLMGRFGGETVHKLHKSAELIVDTHKVPPFWSEPLEKRFSRLRERGAETALRSAKAAARIRCLKQLQKVIAFFRRSSTVVDEEAREIILSELGAAYEEWLGMDWDRMTS